MRASLGYESCATLSVLTTYAHDDFGDLTSIVRDVGGAGDLNQTTSMAYDAFGDAIQTTDPNGITVTVQ